MPRYPLHPASGHGILEPYKKVIRLARYGCANRHFYHIIVNTWWRESRDYPIEQLGTFDPMTNQHNEKLLTINFERLQFWLGRSDVTVSEPVEKLLGIAGFFPITPRIYMQAWRNRKKADLETENKHTEEQRGAQSN